MDPKNLLSEYFLQTHKIDFGKKIVLEDVDASELLVSQRIDLISKYKYIDFKEKGLELGFIKELYRAHIEAFSNGSYIEPGNESKNTIDKFFDTFDKLIDDIKKNGMDRNVSVIPVGKNNVILDGAHRVAIAAYYGHKVPIIRFEELTVNYSSQFFKERLLDDKYLDYLVTEYCKINEGVYFACLWPKCNNKELKEAAYNLIAHNFNVVYSKKVSLTNEGIYNLMIQVYKSHQWIGNVDNGFAGARNKADSCYHENGEVLSIIFESENLNEVLEVKNQIRDLFQLNNHSIHITDNQTETVELAKLLLNSNSIDFLNIGKPYTYPSFVYRLEGIKNKIIKAGLSLDDFVIDSSSTLALYGLRDAEDIDYLSVKEDYLNIKDDFFSNHNKYISFYNVSLENLVYNPENYFIFNDIKFVTLQRLRIFKKNRNEIKDKTDIQLIDSAMKNSNSHIYYYKTKVWINRKKRNLVFFAKSTIILILKKLKLYNVSKKIYISLLGRKS